MRPLDYVVLVGVAVLLFFAIRHAIRHRNESCDEECSSCPYGKACKYRKKHLK